MHGHMNVNIQSTLCTAPICVKYFTAELFGSDGNSYTVCSQHRDASRAKDTRNLEQQRMPRAIGSPALCLGLTRHPSEGMGDDTGEIMLVIRLFYSSGVSIVRWCESNVFQVRCCRACSYRLDCRFTYPLYISP